MLLYWFAVHDVEAHVDFKKVVHRPRLAAMIQQTWGFEKPRIERKVEPDAGPELERTDEADVAESASSHDR